MRHQTTIGQLKQELMEVEIRAGLPRGSLTLLKYPGRGGWTVVRDRIAMSPRPLEARDMLSTLQFTNAVLQERGDRNGKA
jgi:hypothetical protein